jgi:hypothetical protein
MEWLDKHPKIREREHNICPERFFDQEHQMQACKIDGDGCHNDQNKYLHGGYISPFAGTLSQ